MITISSSSLKKTTGMIRGHPIKSILGFVGITTLIVSNKKQSKQYESYDTKKKVLVLPFYKMKIVEEKKNFKPTLSALLNNSDPNNSIITIEIDELVQLIHEAAQDPNIVGLYGIFGQGYNFQTGGWGHLQEIRNAITVFHQSHRIHREPNFPTIDNNNGVPQTTTKTKTNESSSSNTTNTTTTTTTRKKKFLYAYSNSFASPLPGADGGMKEYYLASIFTPHVHLQQYGDINLFGLHVRNTFVKTALDKYGIKIDVFKHGNYKNFANQFTESSYDKYHKSNVEGILRNIEYQVTDSIYATRNATLKNYEFSNFWKLVQNAGSFPAEHAYQIGFVDYLPRKDPLQVLLQRKGESSSKNNDGDKINTNKNTTTTTTATTTTDIDEEKGGKNNAVNNDDGSNKKPTTTEWTRMETDFEHKFGDYDNVTKTSIGEYSRHVKKRIIKDKQKWLKYKQIKNIVDKVSTSSDTAKKVVDQVFDIIGYPTPYYNIPKSEFSEQKAKSLDEKIAVIKIGGAITENTARKAESALRKLKNNKDVKAVVLRVDSPGGVVTACESIYQEIQDLPQKVVVSFGNVSASGGYYISSNADRIFASPMSITGSIGVFMIRMDLTGLAKQYGITFDSVSSSDLAGSMDPFCPTNSRMEDNFANYADRTYGHFKTLVSDGRKMDMDQVETIAQGRVWTGEQAHRIGLVDELGGLDRAIAYCQRNYTQSGSASVISWPPKMSLITYLAGTKKDDDDAAFDDVEVPSLFTDYILSPIQDLLLPGIATGNDVGMMSSLGKQQLIPPRISSAAMSGMMLTVDENWAIRCLLEEQGYTDILSEIPTGFFD